MKKILLSLVLIATICLSDGYTKERPNILFIVVDDLNDWVGCLGGHPQAVTPNIDALADRGTLFLSATCQAPICGPSRASFLTGRYPTSLGLYGQPKKSFFKDTDKYLGHLLPQHFSRHGYTTFGGGKIAHGGDLKELFDSVGPRQSFGPKPDGKVRFHYTPDPRVPFSGTQTDWGAFPDQDEKMPDYDIANWAVEVLKEEHETPWFLAVGFMRPHVPFYVPAKWFDSFPLDKVEIPPVKESDLADVPEISRALHAAPRYPGPSFLRANNNEQWRRCVQAYLACTRFVDAQIGKVIEAAPDDTIIVFASDHGYHLGEKNLVSKHSLWAESLRVPLIIVHPDRPKGQKVKQPVGLIDLFPTFCELAGVPLPDQLEGLSLLPLLKNPDREDWPRPAILSTYGRGNHSLRSASHHYIRFEDGSEEYYDLRNDPHCWNNLAKTAVENELATFRSLLPESEAPYHPASSSSPHNAWFQEHFKRENLK